VALLVLTLASWEVIDLFEGSEELRKNLDTFWRLVVRRRWPMLSTACTIILGAVGVSLQLPNQYISEATIIVEQQQVPERYVTPTSTSDLSSSLQAMEQDVLSSTRLLRTIDDFSLYRQARKRRAPEELVELMRGNIEIKPLEANPERRTVNSFRISFTADNAFIAQQVTSRLTSLFIEENLKTREQQAVGTTTFLQGQLEVARNEYQKQEERLKDFKSLNLGELPEQQQGNLQILSGLQMQLQSTVAALGRAQEQRAYLDSMLTQYRDLASGGGQLPGGQSISSVETLQTELNRLNTERAQLLARDLPQHPDVIKINEEIAQSKALLEQALRAPKLAATDEAQPSQNQAYGVAANTATAQAKSQLEANRLELENLGKDQIRLENEIAIYQRRLNLTPVREQELSAVLSDYNLSKQNYEDLLNKKTQSELASSLEQEQQGQQFRIVDPPSLPTKPIRSKRVAISIGGIAGGLFAALGLAILIELRKATFYTEDEIRRRFEAPFVLGIPELRSTKEVRKRVRWRAVEWASGSILGLVVLAAEIYVCWRA
jgi:polysaccharide chain length determinant protein (PEP-CTERM system associated)